MAESKQIMEPEPDASFRDSLLSGWFHKESGELLEGFKISESDTVLDVGCGEGHFAHFVAEQGAKVILADTDIEKLQLARQRLSNTRSRSVHAFVTDTNPLPLADASVSKIIAMEVLEHVENPSTFMAEIYRVGRPGAQYLLSVPGYVSERIQKKLAPEEYFEKPNHIRIFSPDELEKLAVDAGLTIERKTVYGFYWSIWWFLFWACNQELNSPWHPLLKSWDKTWALLLDTNQGAKIKKVLDAEIPKSQAIIARKHA